MKRVANPRPRPIFDVQRPMQLLLAVVVMQTTTTQPGGFDGHGAELGRSGADGHLASVSVSRSIACERPLDAAADRGPTLADNGWKRRAGDANGTPRGLPPDDAHRPPCCQSVGFGHPLPLPAVGRRPTGGRPLRAGGGR